jgi:hypothetical protein
MLERCSTLAPTALGALRSNGPDALRPGLVAVKQLVKHARRCTDGLIESLVGSPAALPAAAVASGALQRMLARVASPLSPSQADTVLHGTLGEAAYGLNVLSHHLKVAWQVEAVKVWAVSALGVRASGSEFSKPCTSRTCCLHASMGHVLLDS